METNIGIVDIYYYYSADINTKFEDSQGVIKSRKSKNSQFNDRKDKK
jgi:hypothetical protein